jgi:hypothetical protein
MLEANSVQLVLRKHFRFEKSLIDLCLIDASHTYADVRADYTEFAPRCKHIMFHDIVDYDEVTQAGFAGGVPRFWADLKANLNRAPLGRIYGAEGDLPVDAWTRSGAAARGRHRAA